MVDILKDFDKLPDDALVPCRKAWPLVGCNSNSAFWHRVNRGVYPRPRKLPGSHVGHWTIGEIRQIQASASVDQAA